MFMFPLVFSWFRSCLSTCIYFLVISKRHNLTENFLVLRFSEPSQPLSCDVPWVLEGGGGCTVDVAVWAGHSTIMICCSLHFDHLWLSGLVSVDFKEKFLWWARKAALLSDIKKGVSAQSEITVFGKMAVVPSSPGPMISLVRGSWLHFQTRHNCLPVKWASVQWHSYWLLPRKESHYYTLRTFCCAGHWCGSEASHLGRTGLFPSRGCLHSTYERYSSGKRLWKLYLAD